MVFKSCNFFIIVNEHDNVLDHPFRKCTKNYTSTIQYSISSSLHTCISWSPNQNETIHFQLKIVILERMAGTTGFHNENLKVNKSIRKKNQMKIIILFNSVSRLLDSVSRKKVYTKLRGTSNICPVPASSIHSTS